MSGNTDSTDNTDDTLKRIKSDLNNFSEELCNTHRLSSILHSYCKSRKNEDALYEVSYVAELIEKKLSKLGYDLYTIIHCDDKHKTMEEALEELHRLHEEGKIEFVD